MYWKKIGNFFASLFSGQVILVVNFPEFVQRYTIRLESKKIGRQNHQESPLTMINILYYAIHPFLKI